MKIAPPPGVFTDLPPLSATPFWLRSSNIRFRRGIPQTVGLFARFIDRRTDTPVDDLIPGFLNFTGQVDFYADGDVLLIASGRQLVILRWRQGDVEVRSVRGLGGTGRWWFAATEATIIAGRANLSGRATSIDRETLSIATVPNIPTGCVAGGIYAGVLMLAGTESYGDGRAAMTVRWSARRTDPSSSGTPAGPFGFEDWIPSDLNASGEFELENGSAIKAGGTTIFGFIVWTDTAAYEITGRTDAFIFAETPMSGRGILGPKTWVVADERVWWYDQTRTLNVYDGGRPRQIVSPISNAALEVIPDDITELLSLSSDPEHGEISLHYPDRDGRMRELVYNYRDDAWYQFDLDRLNLTPANSPRSSIGMKRDGQLMFYDLREVAPAAGGALEGDPPAYQDGDPPFQPAPTPEAFSYSLSTNWITAGNASVQSLRARNVVLAYNYAKAQYEPAEDDQITVTARSYGKLDLREAPAEDTRTIAVGEMRFTLRVGGKAVQYEISSADQRTFLRFGDMDIEADEAGKR